MKGPTSDDDAPDMDANEDDDIKVGSESRTFVVTATAASLTAFNLGFDLGAFNNVDHRKIWAVYVVATVAFVASYLFDDDEFRLGGWWRIALILPMLRVVVDIFLPAPTWTNYLTAAIVIAAFPFATYVLLQIGGASFWAMSSRLQGALVAITVGMAACGLVVGWAHPEVLDCDDFTLAGEYAPPNCTPSND